MPIRRELRRYYGREWRDYRLALIERHGPICSVCNRTVLEYLNLAHLTHDPRSSDVALMCPADHNRHDAAHRLAIRRRNDAKRAGQLWLFPEVEWAPFPLWAIPRRFIIINAAQEGLFTQ